MLERRKGIARRASLLVIGAVVALELFAMPAASAAPVVSSFTPTSGVIGTTVTITGTGFTGATAVTFNGTAATDVTVNSDTSITAVVPTGATTGAIAVTAGGVTGTSGTNFTVNASPTPTITTFNPTTGAVGSTVTITGTGFTGASAVTFNGTAATTFTVDSDTQITATVPTGATTGDIVVTTPGGTATGATPFTVSATGTEHARDVSLALRRHLFARGHVTSDLDACANGVTVDIQRRRHGHWQTAASTTTNTAGHYKVDLRDRPGKYRAFAEQVDVNGGADTCLKARSPSVRHRHHRHH